MGNKFSPKYQGQAMERIGFLASEDQRQFLANLKEAGGNPSQFIRLSLDAGIAKEKAKQNLLQAPTVQTQDQAAA